MKLLSFTASLAKSVIDGFKDGCAIMRTSHVLNDVRRWDGDKLAVVNYRPGAKFVKGFILKDDPNRVVSADNPDDKSYKYVSSVELVLSGWQIDPRRR